LPQEDSKWAGSRLILGRKKEDVSTVGQHVSARATGGLRHMCIARLWGPIICLFREESDYLIGGDARSDSLGVCPGCAWSHIEAGIEGCKTGAKTDDKT
jgi:hypothetical protein